MTLLVLEGFDHEATADFSEGGTGNQLDMKGWQLTGSVDYTPGRLPYSANSRSIDVADNNPLTRVLPSSYSEIIIGFAARFFQGSGGLGGNITFLEINAGASSACQLYLDSAARINVVDHTGATVATGTRQLRYAVFYYIEVKLVVGSSGSCEVHLNGVPGEIASTTSNFGTTNVDRYLLEAQNLGAGVRYDDHYALDPTTGVNTDFLGDVCVETLYPYQDGTYKQWTPDTGTDHFARVDDGQLDGDTSYVHTATAGNKDSYDVSPTLNPCTVYGVQVNLGAKKNDSGGRTIAPLIRQSGTDYLGTTEALAGDWDFYSWLLDQDPAGSDWLYSTVNGDEFGAELSS